MIALIALALAVAPLDDPRAEARARALEQEIRCVQCENEPISQSTADIAADMRREIRERIAAGESDAAIRASFRARYGDYVTFRPPADARTWALWAAPFALILAGLLGVRAVRRRSEVSPQERGPEEGER